MNSIGEELVFQLAKRGVDTVFGIPGVHTVELYRGLATSGIRHVTPRHEQGAGFMADGYARASGKPGVAFVITGPGLTNTLTAMGQARADSVPMLVVSGVNALPTLGKGLGCLHELPDQQAVANLVALRSDRVEKASDLMPMLDQAFKACTFGRPGPVHIEIPTNIAGLPFEEPHRSPSSLPKPVFDAGNVMQAAKSLEQAQTPVILVGGGAKSSPGLVRQLAEKLDAPVVQTVNARGIMFDHPLGVPASPSLQAVRDLIDRADVVLAIGTEFGPTDYDMYAIGVMPHMRILIRIDISEEQLDRHPCDLPIVGDTAQVLETLIPAIDASRNDGSGKSRAEDTRKNAYEEIGPEYRKQTELVSAIRDAVPQAIIIGDSTQPIYACNLYYDHDRPGGYFNAATGYGALGYAIPASIGAALGAPSARVICITGDGGAQFSLPELMAAKDENLSVTFIVWNNHGYQEIETSMEAAGVTVVGCDPTPPDFEAMAASYGISYERCLADSDAVVSLLVSSDVICGPQIIELCV